MTDNIRLRTGSLYLFTHIGNPALWFCAGDEPMTGTVNVWQNLIADSSYSAIRFTGQEITGVSFEQDVIAKAGTFAVQLNAPGSATFRSVVATGLGAAGRYDCDSGFSVVDGGHNNGWSGSSCGYPQPGPLVLSATNLEFVAGGGVGTVSDAQTVTITNPTSGPSGSHRSPRPGPTR